MGCMQLNMGANFHPLELLSTGPSVVMVPRVSESNFSVKRDTATIRLAKVRCRGLTL